MKIKCTICSHQKLVKMKKILIAVLLFSSIQVFAQPSTAGIFKALQSGDINSLNTYLSSNVELTLLDMEDYLSKPEATQMLKKFFGKYQPKSFEAMHEGQSKAGGLHYTIGELKTTQGTFRVYLLLETTGNKYLIQQIRITK